MGTKNKILGTRPAIKQTKELTLNVQNCSPRREHNYGSISPFEEGFQLKFGNYSGTNSPSVRRKDTNKLTIVLDKHGSRESLKDEQIRKLRNSEDNMDLIELEEINFPNRKPVCVRNKTSEKTSARNHRVNKSTTATPRGTHIKTESTQDEEA